MINGFDEYTHEITEAEKPMIPFFVALLKVSIGEGKAVKNGIIIEGIAKFGYDCTPARVRKIIHFIRVEKLVENVIATSKGYYIEKDPLKLKRYIESLDQRIRSIQEVRDSFDKYQLELL